MADLTNLDLTPLDAPVGAAEVAAYRSAREVEGFRLTESFDEQKDALVRRSRGSRVAAIVLGVVCCILGAPLALLTALVLVLVGVSPPAVVGLIFGLGFLGLGIAVLRSSRASVPPLDELWRARYRFDAVARANGLTYVFRARPELVPKQGEWAGVAPGRNLMDVLRSTSGQKVLLGRLQEYALRSNHEYTVVALGVGARTPELRLKHRVVVTKDEPDPLLAHYRLRSPGRREDAEPYLTPEVVAAILEVAPRFDLQLRGGMLYLVREDTKGAHDPRVLAEQLRIAATVGPLVARAGARATQR